MRPRNAVTAAALAVALCLGAGAGAAEQPDSAAAGWQGLLGNRPEPQLGGRWIVVLEAASLAERVARAGGRATEQQMTQWTDAARDAQERALAQLAFRGAPIQPEQSYVRILNGFAASIDSALLAQLERDPLVRGVYPVRASYPAATGGGTLRSPLLGPASGRRPELSIPGRDGSGVTIALLDTGVDLTHPYIRDALTRGIDILEPGEDAHARQNPTEPGRPERHGTELAGLVAGHNGPGDLQGVAPGATILPVRVAGWQPDATGDVSVYSRTDQLLAGLEAAIDPDGDGDTHDGARIALVGLVEPYASFPDGPLARAVAGALALDMLVVAPSGNDGQAGPSFGSVGAPAGVPDALAVAASDTRRATPTAHVLLRAGLGVMLSGEHPLGGVVGPSTNLTAPVVALRRRTSTAAVAAGNPLARYFDDDGFSTIAGTAVLLPAGPTSPETVRELAVAGVRAVLVDGAVPAGSLGVDEPIEVPILGLPTTTAEKVRAALADGVPVELAVGATAAGANPDLGALAPFSSVGLPFGGAAKPELAAAGVGMVTSEPGRTQGGGARYGALSGSSAAAALVAGSAALLAQARPDLDAAGLRGALVTGSRRRAGSAGTPIGSVDPAAASSVELVAEPPTVAVGPLDPRSRRASGIVTIRNVSRRPLTARLAPATDRPGLTVRLSRGEVALLPGASKEVQVTVTTKAEPPSPTALTGAIRVVARRGGQLRIPWAAAVPVADKPVVSDLRLTRVEFVPRDTSPSVLSLVAGRVDTIEGLPQVLPLAKLEIEVYRDGRRLGRLVRVRNLLPGRYAFGLTGRGPGGGRLARGAYVLRVIGTPVGGGRSTTVDLAFRIR